MGFNSGFKGLRHCATSRRFPGSIPGHWGFFFGSSDSSMCPEVDSASKNEYQDIPGGKDGRCVIMCRVSRNSGALTYQKPPKATRPVVGLLYLFIALPIQTCLYENASMLRYRYTDCFL